MRHYINSIIAIVSALLIISCSSQQQKPRQTIKFTENWHFALGDSTNAINPEYCDTSWRILSLPHDWAIEGDFSEDNPSGFSGGALPGGIGWYRKTFNISHEDIRETFFITFDGVYMNSTVYINGNKLGTRPYGYTTFQYDLTPYINEGKNVIAVRVDNSEQPNSRWYSGCGIYRNVWLTKVKSIFVDNFGTFVYTPLVNSAKSDINIQTTIQSKREFNCDIDVVQTLFDAKGKELGRVKNKIPISNGNNNTIEQHFRLASPHLWTIDDPYRYYIVTELYEKGKILDNYKTYFGIRSFYFDAEDGFILNDKNIKINGVCMHHDLGCLGSAVNRHAIERQLKMLKEMGCNGIRCSHNPPAPELLELCDSLGFIVMDEAFDMWRQKKTEYDYSKYFDEWHERDLTDMIKRDRNHPSIFIWSIGNEVLEQWEQTNAKNIDIQDANIALNQERDSSELSQGEELSLNSRLCQHLADIVRNLDPTRPITAGNNEPNPNNNLFKSNALDIIGYNYHESEFDNIPTNFPNKPFIVTESVSALMTRGYYRMPSDEEIICPEQWDIPYSDPSFACSAYDNCHTPWGCRHEVNWAYVKTRDFISGQFVWTGFDYLGEPTPYGWPARSSYFGIIDLAGFPKDIYYMYQSEWQDKKTVLHLFPHWNWKDGQEVDLWCYYNNADEVELFVNGESHGIQQKDSIKFHCAWRVEFVPGEISAISRKAGKVVAEQTIKTADRPHHLKLSCDRKRIHADGTDLSFITIEVLDKDGNLCPFADNEIIFDIEGTGFIAGVDNGSSTSLERFKASQRKAQNGRCLTVLQSDGTPGNIRLKAKSDGLSSDEITINCVNKEQY